MTIAAQTQADPRARTARAPRAAVLFGIAFAGCALVRAVLLPAAMTLLGDRNWYLPSWLGWLPRLDHERESGTPTLPQGVSA